MSSDDEKWDEVADAMVNTPLFTPTQKLSDAMAEYYSRNFLPPLQARVTLEELLKPDPEEEAKWRQEAAQRQLAWAIAQKYEWFVDRAFKRAFPEQWQQVQDWENHECDD